MKKYHSNILILLLLNFNYLTAQIKTDKTDFFPLKIGNYWIYLNSYSKELDTIRILEKKIIGSDTAYDFDGQLLTARNDTIYEIKRSRNGSYIFSVQYFPCLNDTEYPIIKGGDVLGRRIVKKIKGPYIVGNKKYLDCYEFKEKIEDGFLFYILSWGVGIIEINEPQKKLVLIDYGNDH